MLTLRHRSAARLPMRGAWAGPGPDVGRSWADVGRSWTDVGMRCGTRRGRHEKHFKAMPDLTVEGMLNLVEEWVRTGGRPDTQAMQVQWPAPPHAIAAQAAPLPVPLHASLRTNTHGERSCARAFRARANPHAGTEVLW